MSDNEHADLIARLRADQDTFVSDGGENARVHSIDDAIAALASTPSPAQPTEAIPAPAEHMQHLANRMPEPDCVWCQSWVNGLARAGFRLAPSPAQPTEAMRAVAEAVVAELGVTEGDNPTPDRLLAARRARSLANAIVHPNQAQWVLDHGRHLLETFTDDRVEVAMRSLAVLAPAPLQGADDRLAQAEAVIEQAAFALSMGNVSRGRDLLATYQQSPQAALNEVRAKAAEQWADEAEEDDWLNTPRELRARAAELRAAPQAGDDA